MNILNTHSHPDVMHGSERAMHLGAWAVRDLGHRVFLLHGMEGTAATGIRYDGEIGLPVIFDRRSKTCPPGLADAEEEVERFIRENHIDVVHVHGYPRTETLRRFARKYTTVVTVHVPLCPNGARYLWKERQACSRDIGLGCLTTGFVRKGCGHLGNQKPQSLLGFLRGMTEDRLLRSAIAQCARIVTPSEWMRQRLIQDGMPAEITRTLHVAISGDAGFDSFVRVARPPEVPVVAFVGRLVDFKGPDHLLKASLQIVPRHRVWFIGDGPMRPALERMTDDLGLRDRTTFFGSMPADQIAAYRAKCTVVVVPSLWQESFAMVGPEAMLMQLPVVGYSGGAIPEWLHESVTGRLVQTGDISGLARAVGGILENPAQAQTMGRNARRIALNWRPEKHAPPLVRTYQEAVAERTRVSK